MSLARRSLQITAFICTLIVGAASMAVIVTQTTWFKEWLRSFIVRQAQGYVNGRLSIGRLDGNLVFGVELEDVDVTVDGEKVVEVKDVGLDYNAFTFILGHVVLDDIRLNRPVIRVEKTAEGWNITQLIKARTPDPDEPKRARRPIEIGEIGVSDGTLILEDKPVGTSGIDLPERIEKLDASVGVKSDENELKVDINHVSLRAKGPQLGVNALSGVIRRSANQVMLEKVALRTEESSLSIEGTIKNIEEGATVLDLEASSDKFDVGELARVIPALRGREPLQPAFEIAAKGPVDRLAVDLNARERIVGHVIGDLTVDATAPGRRVAGTVSMEHFNVAPVVKNDRLKSDITGQARIDLALPSGRLPLSGTYSINASRAAFAGYETRDLKANGRIDDKTIRVNASAAGYGGRATAVGTVRTGEPLAVDLQGRAVNVDLRNVPPQLKAPGVPSDLQFDYTLAVRGRVVSGDLRLDASTLAGATIAPGTTASFSVGGGSTPSYAGKGSVENLDIQKIGRGFAIPALAADRFRSRVNATFDVKGSGGGSTVLNLEGSGVIADSELFGASVPRMDVTTKFAGGDAQVKAIGQFAGLNPAVVTENEKHKGQVTGAVDVNVTLRQYRAGVTVDSIDASGRVNLGKSTIAGLDIDSGVVDGTYADRTGELTQFSIAGPDLNLSGGGTIALNETGASNLNVHAESPSLHRVGEVIGKPINGAAIVDAKVTGNARELTLSGTLDGSNIGYGESEALNLDSQFRVAIPELHPADALVSAKSAATFVEIGGQKISELNADTKYSNSKLEFNATAKEGVRQLAAAGSAVFHPDHHEVHLTNLSLRAEQIEWHTAPGGEATIQYGKDRIALQNVRLESGDQRIEADGVLGSTRETLSVRATNVDVAQLDQLMLGDQRLAGRLNVTATVSGPTSAPRANGEFSLTQGAFRQFKFESFGGKVEYGGKGMNIDVRLQQNPQAWLTAKGYAPMSLFRPNKPGDAHQHEAPAADEAIDLQVASSQIDLGVVQGFTSYVTNVTGALQANLRVTGSGQDPHMDGAIDIKGGAFAIPELGTAYTGLDTRIDFKPDAVTISQMRLVDEHKKVLTVGGQLAVHERSVGAVDIKVQSNGFEFIDNKTADLKLDTDVRVTGELRAPRIEGFLEVETGQVNVAEILERTTADPYATEATEFAPARPAETRQPSQPNLFDAFDLNVSLAIPSNLVLKGNDLRPVNAPIDIGDMTVTVGGALNIRKAPHQPLRLIGEVNTIRGNYQFQGRRFEILRDGRIRFSGSDEINPIVDLRARRIISGVETFVRVRGTMRQPELSFSSNPPLDEADILSLIVFNMPVNELGEGAQVSLAERAAALAGGYFASGLTRSVRDALELDEFEISAQGESGAGPSLTVGEQVGEKLFVKLRQGFGAEQATEFIIEYQIADYLRAQASVAESPGGTQRTMFRRVERGGIDLIFFFSY